MKAFFFKRAPAMCLCFCLFLCLNGCGGSVKKYGAAFLGTFDTTVQIIGYEKSKADFDEAASGAQGMIEELHRLFDIYHDYDGISNLKTVNDMAGTAPVRVDDRILELVEFAVDMYSKTDGTVNIALGPVLRIWHDYRSEGVSLPPRELLEEAYGLCDILDVVIDREAGTLFLRKSGMSLDVGACAKGFASGLVAESLPDGYLISAGGNVVVSGAPGDGRETWKIGVQDPRDDEENPIVTLGVYGGAVVTSGDYQRTYTVDGVSYNHIIDPSTLMPAARYRSVSVIGPDSALCDVLSTALFILPADRGGELAEAYGCDVVWILPDMSVEMTEGAREIAT